MKTRMAGLFVAANMACGCAGSLHIYDKDRNELIGVPFRTAEVYVKTGVHGKLAKGGECTKTPFVDVVTLPTGGLYYAAAKTAYLAKTSFHIKYADSGAVAEIGLDSEPSTDALKNAAEALKTVLPLVGIGAAAAAVTTTAAVNKVSPACDVGEEGVKFVKFEDYIKPH